MKEAAVGAVCWFLPYPHQRGQLELWEGPVGSHSCCREVSGIVLATWMQTQGHPLTPHLPQAEKWNPGNPGGRVGEGWQQWQELVGGTDWRVRGGWQLPLWFAGGKDRCPACRLSRGGCQHQAGGKAVLAPFLQLGLGPPFRHFPSALCLPLLQPPQLPHPRPHPSSQLGLGMRATVPAAMMTLTWMWRVCGDVGAGSPARPAPQHPWTRRTAPRLRVLLGSWASHSICACSGPWCCSAWGSCFFLVSDRALPPPLLGPEPCLSALIMVLPAIPVLPAGGLSESESGEWAQS